MCKDAMQFERPVESTTVLISERLTGTTVSISRPAPDAVPSEYDARPHVGWVHPRADTKHAVPTQLLRAVIKARNLSIPTGMGLRVVSVPEMCAQAAPLAYLVTSLHDMQAELVARGPLMTSLPVTPALLAFWSSLLRSQTGGSKVASPVFSGTFPHVHRGDQVLGVVAVAIVGFTDSAVTVALSWGASCDELGAWGHNGCMLITNALAARLFNDMVAMTDSLPLSPSPSPPSSPSMSAPAPAPASASASASAPQSLDVIPLTLQVLQQAAEQSGKLPRKLPIPNAPAATVPSVSSSDKPKGKRKLKIKANVAASPPPSSVAVAAALASARSFALGPSSASMSASASASASTRTNDTPDIAAMVMLGVMCAVIIVLLAIFLRKNKPWNRS